MFDLSNDLIVLFSALLGLVVGSFLSSFTYRLVRGGKVSVGRSRCPKCGDQLVWYDNIPVFSYIVLRGKCRSCRKRISFRYPLIEIASSFLFALFVSFFLECGRGSGLDLCSYFQSYGFFALPYYVVFLSILISIFIIDFENKVIPDSLVFILFILSLFVHIFIWKDLNINLLTAFSSALFLLCLHLITKGKGMGLGDVKLALPLGLVLGWQAGAVWMMLSFIVGAIVGVFMLIFKKASLSSAIPFGPFLILSFFMAFSFGNEMFKLVFPYIR